MGLAACNRGRQARVGTTDTYRPHLCCNLCGCLPPLTLLFVPTWLAGCRRRGRTLDQDAAEALSGLPQEQQMTIAAGFRNFSEQLS